MPSNWLYIDTNFPSFTQKESVNDKVETMQDYLFMLVEQLRYTLHNLDLSNMNKTAADEFVKQITDPIYGEIKDAEGNITQVALVAEGLAARIGDAEGNITQLQATAKGLQASISNLDGAITNIKADVTGIRATVSTKIDATQAQSIFDQSATGFTLGATSGENGTIFKLNYNGAQIASTGTVDLHVKSVHRWHADGGRAARREREPAGRRYPCRQHGSCLHGHGAGRRRSDGDLRRHEDDRGGKHLLKIRLRPVCADRKG